MLKAGVDFKYGYSPERINPGDEVHTLANVIKVVAGNDAVALDTIANTYGLVVKAGVHKATSIKVAEAAKVIENTQRDLNIALMNELSIIFEKMGLNTYEVLEAAGTKWNFLKFSPGLVGGHCIGVDPYYLTYKANQLGYQAKVILAGRSINDEMPYHICKNLVRDLLKEGKNILETKVLVMGVTFKENVSDIRNSKAAVVVKELKDYGMEVDVVDSLAVSEELEHEYGFGLVANPSKDYDAVILAVCHKDYLQLDEAYFQSFCKPGALFFDIKGAYRSRINTLKYWSL